MSEINKIDIPTVLPEEEQQPPVIYKVYGEVNESNQVTRFYSTCFEETKPGDVFYKDGAGDEFVHVAYLDVYDHLLCHNFKVVDDIITTTTDEDKSKELASRPVIVNPDDEHQALTKKMAGGVALTSDDVLTVMEMHLGTQNTMDLSQGDVLTIMELQLDIQNKLDLLLSKLGPQQI